MAPVGEQRHVIMVREELKDEDDPTVHLKPHMKPSPMIRNRGPSEKSGETHDVRIEIDPFDGTEKKKIKKKKTKL